MRAFRELGPGSLQAAGREFRNRRPDPSWEPWAPRPGVWPEPGALRGAWTVRTAAAAAAIWPGCRARRRGWSLPVEGEAPSGELLSWNLWPQGGLRAAARLVRPSRALLCRQGLKPALSNVSPSEAFNPNEILALLLWRHSFCVEMLLKGSAGAAASRLVRVAGFTAAPVEAWGSWPAHEAGTPSLASSATSQRVEMPRVSVGTWRKI